MAELAGVRVEVDAIHELDSDAPVVSVALADIRSVTLRFGLSAERPIAGLVLGLAFIAVGLALSILVLRDLVGAQILAGKAAAYIGTSPVTFLLGVWLSRHSLRKEYFLDVQLENDSRKFPLRGNVQRPQIESFLHEVSAMGDWAHLLRDASRSAT